MMNAFTLPANVKLQPLLICIVSWASAAFAAPNAKPKHNSATRFIGASPSVKRIDRQRQPNLGTNACTNDHGCAPERAELFRSSEDRVHLPKRVPGRQLSVIVPPVVVAEPARVNVGAEGEVEPASGPELPDSPGETGRIAGPGAALSLRSGFGLPAPQSRRLAKTRPGQETLHIRGVRVVPHPSPVGPVALDPVRLGSVARPGTPGQKPSRPEGQPPPSRHHANRSAGVLASEHRRPTPPTTSSSASRRSSRHRPGDS